MQIVKRLIDQYIPEHYSLSVTLNRVERTFSGLVTIDGVSTPEATAIRLHAKYLAIQSVTFDGKKADFKTDIHDELVITHKDLKPGRHIIVVAFSGKITDAMQGIYPCYFEHDGIKKQLLATQFESHYAREAFPCIDEPEAKATFDVTLTTEQDITVLGNMPIAKQTTEDDLLVTRFETTPRMSTYLVAWVVGEMHKKTAMTKRGVEVNVWATPSQPASSFDFALDVATKAIDFYEEFFGTQYPLPKSDHVALPDFAFGAMENWGLITYRETTLLAEPETISISSKQYVALVIAHELAHQWFGNLVTMRWWNNLWLNESFATLMEYLAIDAIHPEWNMWLDFSTNESILALRRDSIDGVQSVQTDVNHPDEIGTIFDGAIVYAKGARLLRMLQFYVGNESFQAGLKQYFKDHAYHNTEADDLWGAIAQASNKDIVGLMHAWLSQPGYPVVHVTRTEQTISLSQEQFFVGPHSSSDRLWPIPLNASDDSLPALFSTKEISIATNSNAPLRLNIGDTAHFITHYDDVTLQALLAQVKAGTLNPLDRLQLLDEAILLVRGNILPSSRILKLIDAYRHETSEQVWTIIFLALSELRKFVEDDPIAEKKLRAFSAEIARVEYERLGWVAAENEDEEDSKLRGTILSLTLYGEAPDVINTARTIYETTDLDKLDAELRPLIISTVVRNGDAAIVDELLATYKKSSSGELRQDISVGITSTRIPEKINGLLEIIKDADIVRPQDAARWFIYMIRGRDSRDVTWQWIRDNWQWVMDTFSSGKSYDEYPRYTATALSTKKQLQEYIDFFTPLKNDIALSRAISMGISEIEGRVELIERDGVAVIKALNDL
ncbi:MAG: putative Aminopeptidase [Candidatus Saccharibacteria bacterium]|nr:putative Aminopeptidase [Candidatus Saccharibacteria bacterium]